MLSEKHASEQYVKDAKMIAKGARHRYALGYTSAPIPYSETRVSWLLRLLTRLRGSLL